MPRATLKQARQAKGMTQPDMAEYLEISLPHYKKLESGATDGSIRLWDKLEELFSIHQKTLRETS